MAGQLPSRHLAQRMAQDVQAVLTQRLLPVVVLTATATPDVQRDIVQQLGLQGTRRRKVPAFRILTDRVLGAMACERPSDGEALRSIHGVGPKLAAQYGAEILALVGRRR